MFSSSFKKFSIFSSEEKIKSLFKFLYYKMKPLKKGNRLDGKLITSKTKKLGWKPVKNLKKYLENKDI